MFRDSVRPVLFREHPIVNVSIAQPCKFDITTSSEEMIPSFISGGKFQQKQYCVCLLLKIFSLKKLEIKSFLQYQCDGVSDALYWLQKLEKLIELNRNSFTSQKETRQLEKTLSLIEIFRYHYETNISNKVSRFDFNVLKKKLSSYSCYSEKISCLLEAKTEYLQNRPAVLNPGEVPFDEKIQLQIDLINSQKELADIPGASGLLRREKEAVHPKAKINCNLNQFVDVFFQLMHERKVNDKPILEAESQSIAEIISGNFLDKSGHRISEETVRTILKPSRIEKRPKGKSKIDFKIQE